MLKIMFPYLYSISHVGPKSTKISFKLAFFAFFCNFWSPMQLKSIRLIHLSKELVEDFRFRASVSLQLYPIYREDPKSTKNSLKLSIFAIFCNFCFPIPRKLNSYDSPVERDLLICIFIDFRCFITLSSWRTKIPWFYFKLVIITFLYSLYSIFLNSILIIQ